jgi:small subunit ribosomal protein S6
MELYENIFIARQDLSPSQVESLTEKFSAVIRDKGGSVEKTEYIGLRTLAYLIKKNRKGHYVLTNIKADASTLKEFERIMRINEDVLRFLTVKVDEHEKGPSSLLKASRYQRDEYDDNASSENSREEEENKDFNTTSSKEGN